ncbi:unnamed protein product [Sphenostylis stenocarpa]|uniref:Uncharacterized protein n=1 Tax=Sphenostylis stenocarpa TaxID=92480 RepID=A0AA86V850_9FABA|nr:unnamed protein product [Sphenostylis stenocarpa]
MKGSQSAYKTYARSLKKSNRRSKDSPNFNKAETQYAKPSHFFSVLLSSHSHDYFYCLLWQIANKGLDGAFTSTSEAPMDSSPISEISYTNSSEDVTISLVEEGLPETLLPFDIMPPEKIIEEVGIGSIKCWDAYEMDSAMSTFIESEIPADLRNAKPKVFNSHDPIPQHKMLVDEITKYVIEDIYVNTVPEDFDLSYRVQSAKNGKVFLCFCIWLIGVLAIFFTSDIHCPYNGPT